MQGRWFVLLIVLVASTVWAHLVFAGAAPYDLQPGDILQLIVWEHPELSQSQLVVAPDGTLSLPLVRELQAAGLPLQRLQSRIETAFAEYVKNPRVSLLLVQAHLPVVYVLGAVKQPGAVELDTALSLSAALARAGGVLQAEAADSVQLVHPDGTRSKYALQAVLQGEPGADPLLRPGDTVLVERRLAIAISGEVKQPGVYLVAPEAGLQVLVALAGGYTDYADSAHVKISSAGRLRLVVDADSSPAALRFEPGDAVYVPRRRNDVTVVGQVKQPGAYRTAPGDSLLDLFALAGGLTETADLRHITLLRRGKQAVQLSLDSSPEQAAEFTLQPGDLVVVPQASKTVSILGAVKQPGTFDWQPGETLASLLGRAGGLELENADLHACKLFRGPDVVSVDLSGYAKGDCPALQQSLQAGDRLVVPHVVRRVSVLGWVEHPGTYTFKPGDTVLDALGLAGGFAKRDAACGKAYLVRKVKGQPVELPVNLGKLLKGENLEQNLVLEPDDLLIVPRKSGAHLDDFFRTVLGLKTLTNLFD